MFSRRRRPLSWREVIPLLLAAACFLVLYSVYSPTQELIHPDSPGYLNFSAKRSGGYPLFLSALGGIVRQTSDYAIAQRLFFAASVLILGLELLRCFERPVVAWLCAIALLFNFEVNRYHFSILSESIFLSVSALFFACALAHLRTGKLFPLLGASIFVGALIAIRPIGIGFLPALIVLPFMPVVGDRATTKQATTKLILAIVVPMLAVMVLEWGYYRANHAGPRESLAPAFILAKSGLAETQGALISDGAVRPDARPLMEALEYSLAPVRKLIAEAPNEPARCQLLTNYEVFLQFRFAPEQRRLATAVEGQRALQTIGLERLKHGVVSYLRHTLDHLYCMWSLGAATEQERASLRAYIDSRSIPFAQDVRPGIAGARYPSAAILVRWTMLGVAALLAVSGLTLLIVVLRGRRPTLVLAGAGLCGIAVHATLLSTALAAVGIPRFVLVLWIPLALGIGFSAIWLWDLLILRAPISAIAVKTAAIDGEGG
jgi:hypothetical protein